MKMKVSGQLLPAMATSLIEGETYERRTSNFSLIRPSGNSYEVSYEVSAQPPTQKSTGLIE